MEENKQITILTVVKNAGEIIRDTLDSVLNQSFSDFEYIVLDGRSTDNTYEIICEYESSFFDKGIVYKHLSEEDKGIYDAMNKGTAMASGSWINYMNAGDVFADYDVLRDVVSYVNNIEDIDIIYGDTIELVDSMEQFSKAKDISNILKHKPFCHQACFTKVSILGDLPYDCQYKIVADYELYLRLYLEKHSFKRIDRTICKYRTDGVSRRNAYNTYSENVRVKKDKNIIEENSLKQRLIDYYYKNLFNEEASFHNIAQMIQNHRKK